MARERKTAEGKQRVEPDEIKAYYQSEEVVAACEETGDQIAAALLSRERFDIERMVAGYEQVYGSGQCTSA